MAVLVVSAFMPLLSLAQDLSKNEFNLNFLGLRKQMTSDWKPVDEQDELGATFDLRGVGWPFSIDLGYLYATKKGNASTVLSVNNVNTAFDNLEREATTEEVDAGIKKIWTDKRDFSVFLGGGAAWIRGKLKYLDVANFDESKVGWYGTVGFYWTIAKFLNLGVTGRYSDVRLDLGGLKDVNAGGWHYGFLAGVHF
jgi:hypothetical protein